MMCTNQLQLIQAPPPYCCAGPTARGAHKRERTSMMKNQVSLTDPGNDDHFMHHTDERCGVANFSSLLAKQLRGRRDGGAAAG